VEAQVISNGASALQKKLSYMPTAIVLDPYLIRPEQQIATLEGR
jgi:hypothetical protein